MPKTLAVLLAMVLVLGTLFGLISIVIVQAISGIDFLSTALPKYLQEWANASIKFFNETILPLADQVSSFFDSFDQTNQETFTTAFKNLNTEVSSWLITFLKKLVTDIPKLMEWIPDTAIGIIFTILSTYFISKQWENLLALSQKKMPLKVFTPVRKAVVDLKKALIGFFSAQLILLAISTVISSISFAIIGIPYPIAFGVLVGLGELIPYIGISSIFIPWTFFAFITGDSRTGFSLMLIFTIVVTIRILIEPKVISKSVGIDPLSTLLVMFIGYTLSGIPGILFGILALVLLTTLYRNGTFRDIWAYILHDPVPKNEKIESP